MHKTESVNKTNSNSLVMKARQVCVSTQIHLDPLLTSPGKMSEAKAALSNSRPSGMRLHFAHSRVPRQSRTRLPRQSRQHERCDDWLEHLCNRKDTCVGTDDMTAQGKAPRWGTSLERSVREHKFELPPNGITLCSNSAIHLHFGFKCEHSRKTAQEAA